MATFVIYECFGEDEAEQVHNLDTDTHKWALTNTAPNIATHDELADITEISAGAGYSAGGFAVAVSTSRSADVTTVSCAAATVTASAGDIAAFRYAVLYSDTATNDELIGYLDYGSSQTIPDGQTLTIPAGTLFTKTT